jgi:hypothetical protein
MKIILILIIAFETQGASFSAAHGPAVVVERFEISDMALCEAAAAKLREEKRGHYRYHQATCVPLGK